MELSAEAMEALNKAMAQQVKEANQAIASQILQQLEQLDSKFENRFKELKSVHEATKSETSEPPSPNEAIRIARGKAHVGESSRHQRRTNKSPIKGREALHNQWRNVEGSRKVQPRPHYVAGHRMYVESDRELSEEGERSDYSGETLRRPRNRTNGREYDPLRQQLNHIKIQFPPFIGSNDAEAYLDWERKMESNFLVQGTYELNKVKIAVSEFNGYALLWWEQLGLIRDRQRQPPITTWTELVTQMRRKFVPAHYQREMLSKLRRLVQGTRSVRDYYQELETLMIRADLKESDEMVMSRFLGGLNRELQDKVELQNYEDVQEMVHKAELIESQLKRCIGRSTFTRTGVGTDSYTRLKYLREEKTIYHKGSKAIVTPKERDKVVPTTQHPKVRSETLKTRAVDAKSVKQHKVEPPTRQKKQKECDEMKRWVQDALEAVEAIQKKRRATHPSVGTRVNRESLGRDVDIHNEFEEQGKELTLAKDPKHVSNLELIDTSETEQSNAEEGARNVEKQSATLYSFTCPDNEDELFAPNPLAASIYDPNNTILTAQSTPHLLLGSKIIKTNDLFQYWHHLTTGYGFKYFCFNVSISNIMHLLCPMSFEKETGAKGALIDVMIKEKPPDWQRLQSVLKELKQGATRQAELIVGCIRGNAELKPPQERSFTCFIPLKEHPPDKCRLNSKQRTYGNYLDSQRRMKPCLLSIGTDQTILTTQWREYDAVNKPNPYQNQGLKNTKADTEHERNPTIKIRAQDKELEYDKISIYAFKDPFILDHTDIIRLFLQRRPNIGRKVALKRTQRIQKWEEDKVFKPPDLFQNQDENISIFLLIKEEPPDLVQTRHQNFSLFILIKEEPPDASYTPKTRLHIFGDNSDLRTNPFEEGEDDVIVSSTKAKAKDEPEQVGLITRSRAKELAKEAHSLIAEGSFSSPAAQVFNIYTLKTSPGNDN